MFDPCHSVYKINIYKTYKLRVNNEFVCVVVEVHLSPYSSRQGDGERVLSKNNLRKYTSPESIRLRNMRSYNCLLLVRGLRLRASAWWSWVWPLWYRSQNPTNPNNRQKSILDSLRIPGVTKLVKRPNNTDKYSKII